MSDLKFSIVTLFIFVVALLGISNVERFQESVINFSPVFFVILAFVLFSELLVVERLMKAGVRLSQYSIIGFWLVVYGVVWYFNLREGKSLEVNLVQLLLVLLTAVLAFDVGRRVNQTDIALEGLASSAYPNRAKDMQTARDIALSEITRSRRYHHPLSVLAIRLEKGKAWGEWKDMKLLANDIMERLAHAKVSQILSDHARSTDLVLRDGSGQFILLCPDTSHTNMSLLADRIAGAVKRNLDAKIECGYASFPDEAVTFDDLILRAKERFVAIEILDDVEPKE